MMPDSAQVIELYDCYLSVTSAGPHAFAAVTYSAQTVSLLGFSRCGQFTITAGNSNSAIAFHGHTPHIYKIRTASHGHQASGF